MLYNMLHSSSCGYSCYWSNSSSSCSKASPIHVPQVIQVLQVLQVLQVVVGAPGTVAEDSRMPCRG